MVSGGELPYIQPGDVVKVTKSGQWQGRLGVVSEIREGVSKRFYTVEIEGLSLLFDRSELILLEDPPGGDAA